MSGACMYIAFGAPWTFELPFSLRWEGRSHKPCREWKKSQKKIRRERRQRMAYKKGGAK